MSRPYRPIDEIEEIFQISSSVAKSVIKKYKVDTFTTRGKIYVHVKDFYTAYTRYLNPSLFPSTKTSTRTRASHNQVDRLDISQ
ncbi:MAG: hypothetical protein WCG98_08250 [bacterium]